MIFGEWKTESDNVSDVFIRIAGRGVRESIGFITINCYSGFCIRCSIFINSHADEHMFNSIACCELYELVIDSGYTGDRLYIPISSNSRISRFSYEDRCSVYMKDISNAMRNGTSMTCSG